MKININVIFIIFGLLLAYIIWKSASYYTFVVFFTIFWMMHAEKEVAIYTEAKYYKYHLKTPFMILTIALVLNFLTYIFIHRIPNGKKHWAESVDDNMEGGYVNSFDTVYKIIIDNNAINIGVVSIFIIICLLLIYVNIIKPTQKI